MQKRGPPKHYVGKIVSREQYGDEYKIQFYKRIGDTNKFVIESEEIYDVIEEDIMMKVPKPTKLGGSARTQGQLWFQVDFSNFNVK